MVKTGKLIVSSMALSLLIAALLFTGHSYAAGDLGGTLKQMTPLLDQSETAVQAGDFKTANDDFTRFQNKWYDVEDDVRALSLDKYKDIEVQMGNAHVALTIGKSSDAMTALQGIDSDMDALVAQAESGSATGSAANSSVTVQNVVDELNDAHEAIARQDASAALADLNKANDNWFNVEDQVKVRSMDAYHQVESDLPTAIGALQQNPPDYATAGKLVTGLYNTLTPIATQTGSNYSAFDAGIVLLREGFEAILIITALIAFVVKSGNGDKRVWIWAGGGLGIIASIITALALQAILGAAMNGENGTLIEGIIGLVAAAMLFYVSYWLHSKSSAVAWTAYIKRRSSAALAGGSLVSLAVLAFLAVYREGAETAVFYFGMAGSISTANLLLGIGGGLVALIALTVLMVKVGVRIPIHTFFLISSALIYYLGFKFVGTGIHSLQLVQALPSHTVSWLPTLDWLGFYPTLEGVIVQGALIIAGVVVWVYSRRAQQAMAAQQAKAHIQA